MWREIIAVFLMTGICLAQTPQTIQGTLSAPNVAEQELAARHVRPTVVERYTTLRRGRDEEVAIFLGKSSLVCPACTPVPTITPGIMEVSELQIEPAPGFSIQYSGDGRHFSAGTKPQLVFTRAGRMFLVRIKATNGTALGQHTLKGKMSFRVRQCAGFSSPLPVEISIPVAVVDHKATVIKSAWPYALYPDHKIRRTVATVLMAPLLVPMYAIFLAYCVATDCEL